MYAFKWQRVSVVFKLLWLLKQTDKISLEESAFISPATLECISVSM